MQIKLQIKYIFFISYMSREAFKLKYDVGDLPSGSKESLPVSSDDYAFPPIIIRYTESVQELHEKEENCHWSDKTFEKKLEQLKEDGEFEYRIQKLINYLNIETFQAEQCLNIENNNFMETVQRIDYLDCSGLHLSKAEKESNSFKPFSQSRVEEFLGWMADCNKVFKKTRSAKCRLILSNLFSAYTKEELLEFKPKDLSIISGCLYFAIENQNHILISELVRSNIFDFDFHLHELIKDKKIPSVVMDTLLSTAKSMILRKCPRLRQNAIRLSFCCECSKESRLVIMMSYKGCIEMKDGIPEKAMGVEVVFFNYTQASDEAYTVFNSFSALGLSCNLPVITEEKAKKLFKKHSNLTLISASPYKSSGYSKGKHLIVKKLCISLLCLHKGYIPFGEREFPKEIDGFEVDVQEGYCSLGGGRSIAFGGHICRAREINTPGHGSIGGFVDLSNGSVGLITCAHVLLSVDELKIPNAEMVNYLPKKDNGLYVEAFDKNHHQFQVCGNIVDKCFPTSSDDNSVDAALVQLDPSVNEFQFPVTDKVYSAGFDPKRPPIFTGDVINVSDSDHILRIGKLDSVLKYGSKSGFTIGNLYFNGAHIRFVNDTGELPDKTHVPMCNQIEIQSLPHGPFFEAGDSGAFVFCINPDKTLSCLGMATGLTSRGSCFVTPIVRILDSFGLPYRLKPCSSIGSEGTLRQSSEVNLEAILMDFKTSLSNMQTSMSNVQSLIMDVKNEQISMPTPLYTAYAEAGNFNRQAQAAVEDLNVQDQETQEGLQAKISKVDKNIISPAALAAAPNATPSDRKEQRQKQKKHRTKQIYHQTRKYTIY